MPLDQFLPATRTWFADTFGPPTPPQAQGWPAIQSGDHTLILAPTGSGKTLTAFLWAIDQLYREVQFGVQGPETKVSRGKPASVKPQTRVLYISPLKALNNDIERNLRVPLAGIRRAARALGQELPDIEVAVRSGDTPQRERQAMLRRPPHILITTPESLYLMLTSPKTRDLLRTVRTVIVDEIHTLAGSKRGVHLSLSLERLAHLADEPIQRIGLSATIQPLDEVARYLGGNRWEDAGTERTLTPRPVTIVNAAYRKALDLRVETVVDDFHNLPTDSIWPTLIPKVVEQIHSHVTTLIFVNDRRAAERAADRINEQLAAEARGEASGLLSNGVVTGLGMFAAGQGTHSAPIRAHHGSVSKEARLALETDLKAGKLHALVGTSSLELGIDIGAVDLVVQLQSPKSVAQGLQRVGRSGHLVGQTSRGRIYPTHSEDLMEAAAVAGGMVHGEVEPTHTPSNPLDVLAQQIVAMVSVQEWAVDDLYDLVRGAYAYTNLTRRALSAVIEMLSGRYPAAAHSNLRARLVWDRVNNRLAALPGARLLALTNGGTISDRGAFSAYLGDGKTKLGELDEEFVYETRVGDTLMLGSQVWRVTEMTDDKIMVAAAPGATPRMPFWRGDFMWRPFELGRRVGAFRRAVAERLDTIVTDLALEYYREIRSHQGTSAVQDLLAWLRTNYVLDENSAWLVVDYVSSQLDHAGAISSDRTVLVELFDDPLGDPRLVVQSPFGGKVNGLWALALAGILRARTGVDIEVQTSDEGILLRFPDRAHDGEAANFPIDLVSTLGPTEARELILQELPDSAVFGAQFRQNAARALLLPGMGRGKRTPFWLQRLRAKDLLQLVRQFDDFPIVAETYRDCLEEVMDLPHLEEVLAGIQAGAIKVVAYESSSPSPVAQSLLWRFTEFYMYEWDAPKAERQLQTLALNRDLLQEILKDVDLADLLRSEAVQSIRARLQHTAPASQARSAEELASLFFQLGDLSSAEMAARTTVDPSGWIAQLAGRQRIFLQTIPTAYGPQDRWIDAEYADEYAAAFDARQDEAATHEARRRILDRYLTQAGPVTLEAIRGRYAFPAEWLMQELDARVTARQLVHGRFTPTAGDDVQPVTPHPATEYVDRSALEQMHRRTLTILRNEVRPVPMSAYADFLAHWQHLHPAERLGGRGALRQVLQQLRAAPVVGPVWERDVLPLRLTRYHPAELAGLCQSGELVWVGTGGVDPRRGRIRFFFRGEGGLYLEPALGDLSDLSSEARAVYEFLQGEGAVFLADVRTALDMAAARAEAALTELVMVGLVTNDSLPALRRIVGGNVSRPAPITAPKPISSLEAQLAERLTIQRQGRPLRAGGVRRPSQSELQGAKRRVRERLAQEQDAAQSGPAEGRWTLVHRFGVLGKPPSLEEQVAVQTRQLLTRYGVVTRDALISELGSWKWSLLYAELQRLELRGEIRRGLFVQGLPGLQFALPDVVERLRASAALTLHDDDALIVMNACDPANIFGPVQESGPVTADGQPLSFARIPSTWLVLQRGLPMLLIEDTGSNLTTVQGADDGSLQRAVVTWLRHYETFATRMVVKQWNGAPVLNGPGQVVLEAAGFYRDYDGMSWEINPQRV